MGRWRGGAVGPGGEERPTGQAVYRNEHRGSVECGFADPQEYARVQLEMTKQSLYILAFKDDEV